MSEIAHLLNQMKAQADMAGFDSARPRRGIVTSYDPSHYSVKVRIEPDGHETGWLPIGTPWSGNEWGLFAPPSVGDQVDVHYQENGLEAGAIGGRYYSDADRPLPTPSGELWIVHATGSAVKFGNDGIVTILAHAGITSSAPTWTHTGNISITGGITASDDIVGKGISLYSHLTSDVQAGSGESGPPVGGGGGGGGGGSGGSSGFSDGDGAALVDYWGTL